MSTCFSDNVSTGTYNLKKVLSNIRTIQFIVERYVGAADNAAAIILDPGD